MEAAPPPLSLKQALSLLQQQADLAPLLAQLALDSLVPFHHLAEVWQAAALTRRQDLRAVPHAQAVGWLADKLAAVLSRATPFAGQSLRALDRASRMLQHLGVTPLELEGCLPEASPSRQRILLYLIKKRGWLVQDPELIARLEGQLKDSFLVDNKLRDPAFTVDCTLEPFLRPQWIQDFLLPQLVRLTKRS
jgi:hypothetical protein